MSDDIKEYIMVLAEGEYIPNRPRTIRVELDHWDDFPRLMYHWNNTNYGARAAPFDKGMLTFFDDQSFEEGKQKLSRLGISYTELDTDTTSHNDAELKEKDDQNKSPYPSNNFRYQHDDF